MLVHERYTQQRLSPIFLWAYICRQRLGPPHECCVIRLERDTDKALHIRLEEIRASNSDPQNVAIRPGDV